MLVTKKIIPQNTYKVQTAKGRLARRFDEPYLNKVADTANKMLTAGLKIPAPFDHHKEAKPRTEEQEKEFLKIAVNQPASAFNNAGYWKRFWVAPDEKGVPCLFGQLDAAGDISDANSPAYKVSKVNEEVSVSISDNFEDGLGRTWTDGLLHVAIVNHAVVPGQEPFMENATVVNMSMVDNEPYNDDSKTGSGSSEIKLLIESLKKLKINLPDNTTSATLLRDLLVATLNAGSSSNNDLEPVPIYMSIGDKDMPLSQQQAEAIVATKAVNPATQKPWTMEDLGFKPAPATPSNIDMSAMESKLAEKDQELQGMKGILGAFKNKFISDAKASVQRRITALVAAGVITKEYADSQLNPKIEFQMSLTQDGQIKDHPLEITLSTLEALPRTNTGSKSGFDAIQDNPFDSDPADIDNETMEKAFKALAADGFLN